MVISKKKLQEQAECCVGQMGDIFWDARDYVGPEGEYTEPSAVAVNTITAHLTRLAKKLGAVVKNDCEDLSERIRLR